MVGIRLADAPRAPSYFSAYFEDQIRTHEEGAEGSLKTLYIDRDPDTFGDICRHLQGESSSSLHTFAPCLPPSLVQC